MAAKRRLKRWAKGLVKEGAALAGSLSSIAPAGRILTYHSIGSRDHEMNVTPAAFAEQMAWLADHTVVVPLEAIRDGAHGVALTFDDGYRDNLTEAAPVLARYGFPATVFMVAGAAGGVLSHDRDEPSSRLMTWDELRALRALNVAVGAHSMTHRRLAQLDAAEQREEIVGSVRRIADELGEPVESFAYPYGTSRDYNETSKNLVAESGCAVAVSNRYGPVSVPSDPFALHRIWIDRTDSLRLFAAKVTGRLDRLSVLESAAAMGVRDWLNGLRR